ncbi:MULTISPECIES: phosphotransferase family protein [Pontibacillus]|uniref:Phosphotransferase family protein n=1 Tax=Pontibacillus chungwhensis TaxID=265426 RepID=A0ABY8UT52_9BACI|nr:MULTISPECIES: phosphotransferase family protein [Pontibacillus]MCD5323216.1 phosphotransferase family protein [Pontibacillus sp. HN14]WIF96603.1 phosphotransferase family protein [Pontibacillus chungwhensis]
MQETQPVRSGEELEVKKLEAFLKEHVPSFPQRGLEVRQFGAGHSNLTYELKAGEWEAVLRRPPLGPVAPKAHDMHREYTILKALNKKFDLAPKPFVYGDESVFGAPFFIMERKRGIVLDTEWPDGIEGSPELGQTISKEMVDRLVELHNLDYKGTELETMGKPEGFMERQVHGWIKRYDNSITDDVKSGERIKKWLVEHIPSSSEASVIHYDYKLNNAMFASHDYSRMVGLFDWEMTTVGDPMADLGVALGYWIEKDDPESLRKGLGKPPLTTEDGFFTRDEFIQRYAEKSGRDVTNVNLYLTFAYFKLAGIVQQIYYRYKMGQTDDPRFAHMNHFVNHLIELAEDTARV